MVLLKASQNSQENTCAGVSLFLETFLKSDSSTGVSLWSLRIFSGHLSCRTPKNYCFCVDFKRFLEDFWSLWIFSGHLSCRTSENDCFCVHFFLELFQKFQKIFRSTSEKMLLLYIIHNAILKGSSHKQFN